MVSKSQKKKIRDAQRQERNEKNARDAEAKKKSKSSVSSALPLSVSNLVYKGRNAEEIDNLERMDYLQKANDEHERRIREVLAECATWNEERKRERAEADAKQKENTRG